MNKVCGRCLRETDFVNGKCIHCGSRGGLIDKPVIKKEDKFVKKGKKK